MKVKFGLGMSIVIGLFVGLMTTSTFAYAQEDNSERKVKTVEGSVAVADWVGSKITLDTLDDQTTISVPKDTLAMKGTDKIDLTDIEQGDDVEVEYYDDPSNGPTAVKITDKNTLNE